MQAITFISLVVSCVFCYHSWDQGAFKQKKICVVTQLRDGLLRTVLCVSHLKDFFSFYY